MSHAFYIYTSWGVSAAVLLVIVGATVIESRRLQGELKRLEAQGIRRRSDPRASGDAS